MRLGLFVCLYVCMYSKTIAPISLIFYTRGIVPLAWSPSNHPGRIRIWRQEFLKDSSPLRDRTKYDIKVRHAVKRLLQ